MNQRSGFFEQLRVHAARLHAHILSRDDMQLAPAVISKRAARRVQAGIRALEAYLRRFVMLLALEMEAGLAGAAGAFAFGPAGDRRSAQPRGRTLLAFLRERAGDFTGLAAGSCDASRGGSVSVSGAVWLARLAALKRLIDAPEKRARRLAWHLARRRAGLLLAPGSGARDVPARFGTQASALYAGMAPAIVAASRARPPPLGPRQKAPPRIRGL